MAEPAAAEPAPKGWRRLPKQPRMLVTNDDGINAPGLRILERVARSVSDDVWVVAPETNQSGASHSLTINRPLRIRQVSKRRFAVDGTPTDCVLLALQIVMKDSPAELVLSGVNQRRQSRRGRHLLRHRGGGHGGDHVQRAGDRLQPGLPERSADQVVDRDAACAGDHRPPSCARVGRRMR